jgi:hypothetical protein
MFVFHAERDPDKLLTMFLGHGYALLENAAHTPSPAGIAHHNSKFSFVTPGHHGRTTRESVLTVLRCKATKRCPGHSRLSEPDQHFPGEDLRGLKTENRWFSKKTIEKIHKQWRSSGLMGRIRMVSPFSVQYLSHIDWDRD